jgi:hypothetical protein
MIHIKPVGEARTLEQTWILQLRHATFLLQDLVTMRERHRRNHTILRVAIRRYKQAITNSGNRERLQ